MNVYNEEKLIKSGFVQQTIKEIVLAVKKLRHTDMILVNCVLIFTFDNSAILE
jgi:hypothetical protein